MSTRKQELSVMNVMFCIFVILIHILSYPVSMIDPGTFKFTIFMIPSRMFAFVVQGFIFLAGVKMFLTGKENLKYTAYLLQRFQSVVVPYIICAAVYCLWYPFLYYYRITLDFYLEGLVLGTLCAHFYFIPLLVQFDLLLPLWKRIVNKCSPVIVIPAFILVSSYFETNMQPIVQLFTNSETVIYNDRLFTTYLSFWIIGCYVGKHYESFCNIVKSNFKFICAFFGTTVAVALVANYMTYNEISKFPSINTVHYIYSLFAIFFIFALSLKIPEGKTARIPFFGFVDKNSYSIYLWHMLVIMMSDMLVRDFGLAMQSLAFVFRLVFVFPVTFVFVYLFAELRKRLSQPTGKHTKNKDVQIRYTVKSKK